MTLFIILTTQILVYFYRKDIEILVKKNIIKYEGNEFIAITLQYSSIILSQYFSEHLKDLKTQFLLTIQHELNNPLNSLLPAVEDIIQEYKSENNKALLILKSRINLSISQIKFFIKNLIFSIQLSINEGLKELNFVNINLKYIIDTSIKSLNDLFKFRNYTIMYYSNDKQTDDISTLSDYSLLKALLKKHFNVYILSLH